jgi:hypothetical protein
LRFCDKDTGRTHTLGVQQGTDMKSKIYQGDLALARRIRAAGVPIYIGEDDGEVPHDPSSGLFVYQEGGVMESRAFDFYGAAGFIIRVVITINLPKFAIAGFGLELPWKSQVRWLEDPLEIGGDSVVYRFGGRESLEFERSQVLNHFADVRRLWSRGESLRGSLLGVGNEPVPEEFRQGAMIPAFLIIHDQFLRPYRSSVSLWTDRTGTPVRDVRLEARRKGSLLDRPDPIPGR